MEKVKISFGRKLLTAVLVFLTATMLLLASAYISGTQLSKSTSAINHQKLPDSTVKVGSIYGENTPIYEKDLLPASYAAIVFGGRGGGAYGSEAAAKSLFDFAAEPLHAALSSQAKLSEITKEDFISATYGDYLALNFYSALPYQIVYALTGEYVAPLGSGTPINIDRVILSFPTNTSVKVYASDGEKYYLSDTPSNILAAEAYALAGDSRLNPFTVCENGVCVSGAPLMLAPVTLKNTVELTPSSKEALYSLFGYEYAENEGARSAHAVAPHGSMRLTSTSLTFTASQDSGLALSNFLPEAKSALDIKIYDILLGGISLAESVVASAPEAFLGIRFYPSGFYRDGDTYVLTLSALAENVTVGGTAYPHFARISVQSGRIKSVNIRFLTAEKDNVQTSSFSSMWQYDHASDTAKIDSIFPAYRPSSLPAEGINAAWYFTGEKLTGGDMK